MRTDIISVGNICPCCKKAAVTLKVVAGHSMAGLFGECSSCQAVSKYVTPHGPKENYMNLLKEWIPFRQRVSNKLEQ